ncbi:MAG: PDZ domain-containing protein [Myxococcota bacterium]
MQALRLKPLCLVFLVATAEVSCGPPPAGGIHARLSWSEAAGLRVVEVPAGPSASAGLRPGDRVLAIDHRPVRNLVLEEAIERLRGPVGTQVKLQVQQGTEPSRDLIIERVPYRGSVSP